jgi:hypothetical protein
MPTPSSDNKPTAAGGSADERLARLLETPHLGRVVPHLAPETLHRIIQVRGLDACADLVTSATAAQLTSVLDLDLWRHGPPGRDERLDVDRFGEWLEVLVDADASAAARTVAAIDRSLLIAGLSRYLRVFDPGTFEPTEATDDEPADRHEMMNSETAADMAECELGGYLVRARRSDAWDAIVTLLHTLESDDALCFQALMQGCRRLSNSTAEVDGLDDLLTAPEQHLHDVAMERQRRRSLEGYATPADARAFLRMARLPQPATATQGDTRASSAAVGNPVARAYFRAVDEKVDARAAKNGPLDPDIPESLEAIVALLTEAGMMPERPRPLLGGPEEAPAAARVPTLRRLMEWLPGRDESAYLARSRELAFLANTLLAGCTVQSRAFAPGEASDAAASICNLGLDCWPALDAGIRPDAWLADHDLVTAFEVGWAVLYQDVSVYVSERLLSTLADIRCADVDTRRGLAMFRRALAAEREAGTPWLARDAADVLATLDATAWVSVLGLLDECPVLPAALAAIIEGRKTTVSANEFEFIATTAQLGDIRLFMRMLPALLSA